MKEVIKSGLLCIILKIELTVLAIVIFKEKEVVKNTSKIFVLNKYKNTVSI